MSDARRNGYFQSWSNRKNPDPSTFTVGLAYCIDMDKYQKSLIAHGASVSLAVRMGRPR
jgi:hypothetical protein